MNPTYVNAVNRLYLKEVSGSQTLQEFVILSSKDSSMYVMVLLDADSAADKLRDPEVSSRLASGFSFVIVPAVACQRLIMQTSVVTPDPYIRMHKTKKRVKLKNLVNHIEYIKGPHDV